MTQLFLHWKKNMLKHSLEELLSALLAQEQQSMISHKGSIEGALQEKVQFSSSAKGNKGKGRKGNNGNYEVTTSTYGVSATNVTPCILERTKIQDALKQGLIIKGLTTRVGYSS